MNSGRTTLNLSQTAFERELTRYRASHEPDAVNRGELSRSAVAIVVRFEGGAPSVLLMKRAERKGDRWSGQISLPGGREAPSDRDLLATAVRETREEVGLDLESTARSIGGLDTIRARAKGGMQPLTITPYVFIQTRDAPLILGHEAQDAFWFPIERAATGGISDQYSYVVGAIMRKLPCWRYDGHVIWGLTYKILQQLLAVVGGR